MIVATDHGRDPATGSTHGGQTNSERRIFIASNEELASFSDPVPQTSIVATILDRVDLFPDFDPAKDLDIRIDAEELTLEEQAAAAGKKPDDIEIDL